MAIAASTERLTIAMLLAVTVHAIAILTVGFNFPAPSDPPQRETLEVILVQKRSEDVPDKADFIAQANSVGSGSQEEVAKLSTPTVAPFPDSAANLVATPPDPQKASAAEQPTVQQLTTDQPAKTRALKVDNRLIAEQAEVGDAEEELQAPEPLHASTLIMNAMMSLMKRCIYTQRKMSNDVNTSL